MIRYETRNQPQRLAARICFRAVENGWDAEGDHFQDLRYHPSVYSELFTNPFLAWGKYRSKLFKTTLSISFQFHHAQMDGFEAARFLNGLQETINGLTIG